MVHCYVGVDSLAKDALSFGLASKNLALASAALRANRADIGDCGSLRVIPTLEFLERPFSKLGHRDLLVTHTIWQRRRPLALITRSVRRASGLVQTALAESGIRG